MSTLKVNPVMYLISDPRVEMSKGKFGAQAGHAVCGALEVSPDDRLRHIWETIGQTKIVLMTDDLVTAQEYIEAHGFACRMVIDEGRTEFSADLTRTFLGVQVLDKNRADVQAVFSQFKLYKASPEMDPEVIRLRMELREMQAQASRMLADLEALEEGQRSPFTKLKERFSARTSRRDSRDS